MFKVGEYVIYRRDFCQIKSIVKEKYYKLSLIGDDSLLINVPIDNRLGLLRYPMTKKEAQELIDKIPNIKPIKTNDKLLEHTYKELMRSNKQEDLIKIIKTTYLRNKEREDNGKKAGDKDQTFFKQVEKFLYNELSYALNISYQECRDYITEHVNKVTGEQYD